jgi:hypothetical protein
MVWSPGRGWEVIDGNVAGSWDVIRGCGICASVGGRSLLSGALLDNALGHLDSILVLSRLNLSRRPNSGEIGGKEGPEASRRRIFVLGLEKRAAWTDDCLPRLLHHCLRSVEQFLRA